MNDPARHGLGKRLKNLYWKLRSKDYWGARMHRLRKRTAGARAFLWRRLMFRTTFIAVSGSVGKTTTKELLAAILREHHSTNWSPGNWNLRKTGGIEQTILHTRPSHRFCIVETSTEKPGDMQAVARLLKPDVAMMLEVKRCHTNTFKTLEAIANEKAQLLRHLGRGGRAVINQDNPYVARMVSELRCKVTRFGAGEGVDLRLRHAESRWPNRLRMQIEVNGSVHDVATRLVGTHWAPAVMASLATATACGVPLQNAIASLGEVEPFWARMQPITLPDSGATILRDDWNGSIDTFEPAFKVMEEASAERKIVIFSDYTDSPTKLRSRASRLGKRAAELADMAVFVGDYADRSAAAATREGLDPENVHEFVTISATIEFLRSALRQGDLALLKGQGHHHLSRIYLGLLGDIGCTRPSCSKMILCDRCPELGLEWRPDLRGLMAEPRGIA